MFHSARSKPLPPRPACQPRRAFSLIELLVVISIIGLLMGLLLPAVQAVRESARRTQCQSNLRQTALGVHMNHDTLGWLPSGWTVDPATGEPGWGWASRILPFIEQNNLADRIDYQVPIGDPIHADVVTTLVPIFLCPSDPGPERMNLFHTAGHGGAHFTAPGPAWQVSDPFLAARGNFSGVFGTSEIEDGPDTGEGIFYQNSRIKFSSIVDGLSQTLMIGERHSELGGVTWLGAVNGIDEPEARIVAVADHVPNHPDGHFEDFRSGHRVGVNFATSDASVRLLTNQIDLAVYQAICTRNGREVVADDF